MIGEEKHKVSEIEEIEKRLEQLSRERSELLKKLSSLRLKNNTKNIPLLGRILDISSPNTPEEKINLFKELFCCREDIFPKFWENEKTGKRGYSPVCSNEWVRPICRKPEVKCSACQHQSFLPLDEISIKSHLQGFHIAGTYAIRENNTCIFLVADFDKASWKEDSLAYKKAARELGVEVCIERSKSGNGAHAWIFFQESIWARKARQVGTLILVRATSISQKIKLNSHDRFFPSQDTVPKGGFGNLIALPLQRVARGQGNSVFVDDEFRPVEDQWKFLSGIRRLSQDDIDLLLNKNLSQDMILNFDIEDFDLRITEKVLDSISKKLKLEEFYEAINLRISDQIYINTENLPDVLIGAFRRKATFANPEFFKRQKMRFSTWDTPRFICCAENLGNEISVPRGSLDECLAIASEVGANVNIFDERPKHKKIKVKFTGELRQDQKKAIREIIKYDTGVLVAPPGVGKTVIGCHLIAKRKVPTLVLVHRRPLMDQWVERLKEFLDIAPKEIGSFGGSKKRPKGKIDVAMLQTLSKLEDCEEMLSEYGQIIVDECHHIPAQSFEQVMKKIPAKYFVGLTATPYRKDGHQAIIHMQLGPTRHEMEDFGANALEKKVFIKETNLQFPESLKRLEIHEIWDILIGHDGRTSMIVQDIKSELEANRFPLIISERKEHLANISTKIKTSSIKAKEFILIGDMGKKKRTEILDQIHSCVQNKEQFYILSTGSFIGEGFDLPILDSLILTMPVSFKGRLVQYAGRIHRIFEKKEEVRIFDYLDPHSNLTIKMLKKRIPVYKKMGYEIISDHGKKVDQILYQTRLFSEFEGNMTY